MKPQITLRQLRYFLAVARAGSLTAASRSLMIAQPALTRHIKAIEKEFQTKLFARNAKGVGLTLSGEILMRRAEAVFGELTQAYEELGRRVSWSGEIRLALTPSIGLILDRVLRPEAKRQFPDIKVHTYENMSGNAEDWLDWIRSDLLDVAVLFDVQDDSRLRVRALLEEDLYLIGCADMLPTHTSEIRLEDICHLPLILPGKHLKLRQKVDEAARRANIQLNIRSEEESILQMISSVRRGEGMSIQAWSAVAGNIIHGELKALLITPPITRIAHIVSSDYSERSATVHCVEKLIVSLSKQMISSGDWKARLLTT